MRHKGFTGCGPVTGRKSDALIVQIWAAKLGAHGTRPFSGSALLCAVLPSLRRGRIHCPGSDEHRVGRERKAFDHRPRIRTRPGRGRQGAERARRNKDERGTRHDEHQGGSGGPPTGPGAPNPRRAGGPDTTREGGGSQAPSTTAARGEPGRGRGASRPPQGPQGPAAPARGPPPPDEAQQARRDLKRGRRPTRADGPGERSEHHRGWGDPKATTRSPGKRGGPPHRRGAPAGRRSTRRRRAERAKRSGKEREADAAPDRAARGRGFLSAGGVCGTQASTALPSAKAVCAYAPAHCRLCCGFAPWVSLTDALRPCRSRPEQL